MANTWRLVSLYAGALCLAVLLAGYQNCGPVAFKKAEIAGSSVAKTATACFDSITPAPAVTITPAAVHVGDPVLLSVSNAASFKQITVDWGDGTPAVDLPLTGSGAGTASHSYTTAKTYLVSVSVTDACGKLKKSDNSVSVGACVPTTSVLITTLTPPQPMDPAMVAGVNNTLSMSIDNIAQFKPNTGGWYLDAMGTSLAGGAVTSAVIPAGKHTLYSQATDSCDVLRKSMVVEFCVAKRGNPEVTYNKSVFVVGEEITFTVAHADDYNSISVNFGDGTMATILTAGTGAGIVKHTYSQVYANLVITFTAKDSCSDVTTGTRVTVINTSVQPPNCTPTGNPYCSTTAATCNLTPSGPISQNPACGYLYCTSLSSCNPTGTCTETCGQCGYKGNAMQPVKSCEGMLSCVTSGFSCEPTKTCSNICGQCGYTGGPGPVASYCKNGQWCTTGGTVCNPTEVCTAAPPIDPNNGVCDPAHPGLYCTSGTTCSPTNCNQTCGRCGYNGTPISGPTCINGQVCSSGTTCSPTSCTADCGDAGTHCSGTTYAGVCGMCTGTGSGTTLPNQCSGNLWCTGRTSCNPTGNCSMVPGQCNCMPITGPTCVNNQICTGGTTCNPTGCTPKCSDAATHCSGTTYNDACGQCTGTGSGTPLPNQCNGNQYCTQRTSCNQMGTCAVTPGQCGCNTITGPTCVNGQVCTGGNTCQPSGCTASCSDAATHCAGTSYSDACGMCTGTGNGTPFPDQCNGTQWCTGRTSCNPVGSCATVAGKCNCDVISGPTCVNGQVCTGGTLCSPTGCTASCSDAAAHCAGTNYNSICGTCTGTGNGTALPNQCNGNQYCTSRTTCNPTGTCAVTPGQCGCNPITGPTCVNNQICTGGTTCNPTGCTAKCNDGANHCAGTTYTDACGTCNGTGSGTALPNQCNGNQYCTGRTTCNPTGTCAVTPGQCGCNPITGPTCINGQVCTGGNSCSPTGCTAKCSDGANHCIGTTYTDACGSCPGQKMGTPIPIVNTCSDGIAHVTGGGTTCNPADPYTTDACDGGVAADTCIGDTFADRCGNANVCQGARQCPICTSRMCAQEWPGPLSFISCRNGADLNPPDGTSGTWQTTCPVPITDTLCMNTQIFYQYPGENPGTIHSLGESCTAIQSIPGKVYPPGVSPTGMLGGCFKTACFRNSSACTCEGWQYPY